jgi:hypothetical protein
MKLKDYIKSKNVTLKQFCQENDFNYDSFRVMLTGSYTPSPDMALKIEQATNGQVNRLDLLYPKKKIT